jgi:hypothetical protein
MAQDKTTIANKPEQAEAFKDLLYHPEISSEINEDETELFPEVTEPDVQQQLEQQQEKQPKQAGRPKGAKNKVWEPKPEFNRQTRSQQKTQIPTVFYNAYAIGASSIYDNPVTVADAIKRPNWPEWKKAINKEYRGI